VVNDANAVLVTAVDLGEPTDIHPANKQVVGERLARALDVRLYGQPGSASGPMIRSAIAEGNRVVLDFDGVEGALVAYGSARPIGFEICDESGCRWTDARIAASRIILEDAGGARKVRFCWADAPTCNLYDRQSGLPVVPFEHEVKR
jgi:sialate O-acetylesterase